MNDDLKTARSVSGMAVFLLFVPLLIWRAFVLTILWSWFLTPLVEISPPSIPGAIGVLMVWTIFSSSKPSEPAKTVDDVYIQLFQFAAYGFGLPLISLIIGAVVRGFA